jgi:hypothetical protein
MNLILCNVLKGVEKKYVQNSTYELDVMKTAIARRVYTASSNGVV